jgi:hypothetical protein
MTTRPVRPRDQRRRRRPPNSSGRPARTRLENGFIIHRGLYVTGIDDPDGQSSGLLHRSAWPRHCLRYRACRTDSAYASFGGSMGSYTAPEGGCAVGVLR